jgi:hypothetical protein
MEFKISSASDYLNRYPSRGTSFEVAANLHTYILNDFYLFGDCGLPMDLDMEVIKDRLINFDIEGAFTHSSVASAWQWYAFNKCMPLYGDWAEGFWHWMMENLPYVILAEDAAYDGYYVIPTTSFSRQSIELLGVHPDRIIDYRSCNFQVERLYLPQRIHGWALDNYPYLLNLIRQKILAAIHHSEKETRHQRIYISRNKLSSQRRMVVNEDALLDVLSPYGFKTIYMEDMSLKEQLTLMANAEVLITPHGAAMVHTLFMPPQSLILELFAPTYINPTMLPAINLLRHK